METSVNNKCKAFTSLKQSKKLAEILPLESADMYYDDIVDRVTGELFIPDDGSTIKVGKGFGDSIVAWSLAALLRAIPKRIKHCNVLTVDISENEFAIRYDEIAYRVNNDLPDITKDNPVDACVAMIEKLNELKML